MNVPHGLITGIPGGAVSMEFDGFGVSHDAYGDILVPSTHLAVGPANVSLMIRDGVKITVRHVGRDVKESTTYYSDKHSKSHSFKEERCAFMTFYDVGSKKQHARNVTFKPPSACIGIGMCDTF